MSGTLSSETATPLYFFACAKKRVVFLLAIPYADGFGHRSQALKGREVLRTQWFASALGQDAYSGHGHSGVMDE